MKVWIDGMRIIKDQKDIKLESMSNQSLPSHQPTPIQRYCISAICRALLLSLLALSIYTMTDLSRLCFCAGTEIVSV